jgi:hypothetical protein
MATATNSGVFIPTLDFKKLNNNDPESHTHDSSSARSSSSGSDSSREDSLVTPDSRSTVTTLDSPHNETTTIYTAQQKKKETPTKKIIVKKETTTTVVRTTSSSKIVKHSTPTKKQTDEPSFTADKTSGKQSRAPARNSPSPTKQTPKTPAEPTTPVATPPKSAQKKRPKLQLTDDITTSKRSWKTQSPAFSSLSPRFKSDTINTSPSSTSYNINASSFSDGKTLSPSAAFKSQAPRFNSVKNNTPGPNEYQSPDFGISSNRGSLSGASMKDTSKRFTDKIPTSPPPTKYALHSSFSNNLKPSSPFSSTSPRFQDKKVEGPSNLAYDTNKSSFKISTIPSATFKSTSSRFQTEKRVEGPDFIAPQSTFGVNKHNLTSQSFISRAQRFKETKSTTPGPGSYHIPELPESLYEPSQRKSGGL